MRSHRPERRLGWVLGTTGGAALLALSLVGSLSAAVAEPAVQDDARAHEQPAVGFSEESAVTAGNDAVVDVIADLEAHGMGGVRSEFSEVFAGVVLADGGAALEVLVNVTADPEKLSEFFARVDTVSDAARIEVRLREVSFDPAATAELAQRIAANAPDVRGQLGIRSVSAVQHDTVSGAITVFAADPAVETRTVEIDGIPVTVSGETVELTAQHRTVG